MKVKEITRRNPVAKNMNKFNKAATHKDPRSYTRKAKHKKRLTQQDE